MNLTVGVGGKAVGVYVCVFEGMMPPMTVCRCKDRDHWSKRFSF